MKKILLGILLLTALQINAQYTFEQIDIWTGSSGSSPKYITEFNGQLYFQAAELSPILKKLYKSDGTVAGTTVVAPNINGTETYSPESLHVMNGELYFTAFVSGIGTELFKTDGTNAGTVLIKDIRTGSSNGMDVNANNDKQLFVEFNNELYFRASTGSSIELWKTNGTESGTVSVKNFEAATNGAPNYMSTSDRSILGVVFNGSLYFYVSRGGVGELWKTDGTTANTVLVRNNLNAISNMIIYNNELYFVAEDPTNGKGSELWVTDGTTAGTMIRHDIFPNNLNPFFGFGSSPDDLIIFNNELYFSARGYDSQNNQIIGDELWKTDGTTATLIKDIKPGDLEAGINIPNFTIYNNELYFVAEDANDNELWKTDGTESGTVKVLSVTDMGESTEFRKARLYAGKLFYISFSQLWVTDGTPAGTAKLTGNTEEILSVSTISFVEYMNKLWFQGNKSGNGAELTSLLDNSTLNIQETSAESFQMYPNPATDKIHFSNLQAGGTYRIYNTLGKTILQGTIHANRPSVDISNVSSGLYIVELTVETRSKTFKLIKN